MSFFSIKNLLIFGVLLLLLVGIPVGVYLAQQQQTTESEAEQSSTLSFEPETSDTEPLPVTVGEEFKLDLMVDPGVNGVTVVSFEINYDPTQLAPAETTPFAENKTAFPVVIDPPIFEEGIIRGKISTAGVDKAIRSTTTPATLTRAATFTFVPLVESVDPITISFGRPFTQLLSGSSVDEAAEDVLSSTSPAFILATSGEVTPSGSLTPTVPPKGGLTLSPTQTPTASSSGSIATNKPPVCTSFTANGALEGVSPFAASFTAVANDVDGNVDKITFNFGDGQTKDSVIPNQDVASNSAQTVSIEHTYTTAGTFKASAIATDHQGGVSALGACELTMTITSPVSPTQTPDSPVATLEPTGPVEAFMGIGIVAGILTFIGGLLFFTL